MDTEARVASLRLAGDHDAAATVVLEAYGPGIRRYLASLLDPDDADDVFANLMVSLWRALPRFRGECPLRAWAFRLAWTQVARFHRDPYRRRGRRLPTSAASRLAASIPSGASSLGQRLDDFRALQAELSPRDQTLLVLRLGRELEWDEVAAVLSRDGARVASPALRKRYERLKKRLVERARERGLVE
jgi:RNA polymerase sigma-70 factor (ECF subfamily)